MSVVAELLYSRRVPQVAVLALISFSFAGCSADMSSRLSQSNFSNPFSESTGSVQQAPPPQRELPQYARPQTQPGYYQSQPLAPPAVAAPQSYPVAAGGGVSGGGRGLGSYTPPAQPHLETTGTVPPRSVAAAQPVGGTKIIIGTSDTLDVLAKRYHVTPQAIMAANGYKGPRALSPGQQLVIPHPGAPAPVAAAPAVAPKAVAATAAPSSFHFVNHGDTLARIARKNHISAAELAHANGLEPSAKLRLGTKLTVPGAKTAAVAPLAPAPVAAAPVAAALQPAAATPVPTTKVAAVAGPAQSARLAQATANIEEKPAETPAKAAETTSSLPTFRWPVRGKVITSYGAKTNGKSNDGINVAVPEGTPIKAAEDGVVAYSGNELKGYGNLVLVRHSNGYVTAYAHASELLVKRGDTIKRGQVIAKSGQSGEVASPQLHFEIRKGSSPVDPLQFLNGA
ncbi:Murein DD-endopeptidase MepM and murein hydrolase activator NlpD, contain LysM domain [Bradyrhizobium sp. Ghvi]|uniref:LysM peptidoglycan-binding domain-containing M23 family metallopeptidase n=1 Tax=Bradyrhizobium sp. Ghvi TaxID=1855319 RepID=UPI0008EE3EDA|nr:LysM peptidoglycan-binding domain-containing M23 family metallopeptidase [Bradyrhizobium sp. Ghvi]SFO19993.1 Murein DD-endopeptidase MepM and murein hydrolase activator NlpD, contain LysM domain [Bradyrhizobium sp. Ghvi]